MAPLNLTPIHTPEVLQTSLVQLVEQAQSLSIPPVQAIYDPRQLENLFHNTQRLHEQSSSVFERMQQTQGLSLDGFGDFFEAQAPEPQGLEESSFASYGKTAQDQIAPVANDLQVDLIHSDPPMLIAQCAKLKGIIIKACVNLERQAIQQVPHKLAKYLDQHGALATRDAYAQFRWTTRSLDPQTELSDQDLVDALSTISGALSTLRQSDIFTKMYYRDRLQVVDLHQRATALIQKDAPGDAGNQLLAEAVNFRDGLAQLNQRQELVEHDRTLLDTILNEWHAQNTEDELSATHWDRLQPLWGLNEQIDEWLQGRPAKSFGLVRQTLKQQLEVLR